MLSIPNVASRPSREQLLEALTRLRKVTANGGPLYVVTWREPSSKAAQAYSDVLLQLEALDKSHPKDASRLESELELF